MATGRFFGPHAFAVLYLLIPTFASAATLASVSAPRAVSTEVNQALQNSLGSSITLLQAVTTSATLEAYAEPPVDAIAEDGTVPAGTTPKKTASLKKMLKPGVKLAAEPAASNHPRPAPGQSLADFLAKQLGPKFHRRAAWSGNRPEFMPLTSRKRTWGPMGTVRAITIHHAEGVPAEHPAQMIRTIFRGHTTAGGRLNAADIGYHFFVDRNGEVWEARSATKLGTHVGSTPIGLNNTGNIGICGLGTFLHEAPPKAMVGGIVNLSRLVSDYYDKPLAVRGHEDWVGINHFFPRGGIDCPGRLESAVTVARKTIQKEFAAGDAQTQASVKETPAPTRIAKAGK